MNKHPIYLSLALAVALASCGDKAETERLAARCDSLELANQDLSSFIGTVAGCIDSISIDNISSKLRVEEAPRGEREALLDRISAISATIDNQRSTIDRLSAKIDSTKPEAKNLRALVENLKQQLAEREATIENLRKQIEDKDANIASLNKEVKELNVLTEQQEEALTTQDKLINTAYVKIATEKELKAAGLLSGGGLFKKKKLDPSAINASKFEEIDIRETTEFKIPGKKAKVLSAMPEGSYTLTDYGDSAKLRILDPTRFWSVSNFLIVSYK